MTFMQTNQRFFDVQNEPLEKLPSIEGYADMPLVSLKMAVENLESPTFKIVQNACTAVGRSAYPANDLTQDESASICLYTMNSKSNEQSLCVRLNDLLRSKDRFQLIPYYSYMKLFLSALWKIKSVKKTVWRGVKADLRNQYPVGKLIFWWGLSSCVESLEEIQSEKFIGKTGPRTLFQIECQTGKPINAHSYFYDVNEILLLPATQFVVVDRVISANGSCIIRMKEIRSTVSYLQVPLTISEEETLMKRSKRQRYSVPVTSVARSAVQASVSQRSQSVPLPSFSLIKSKEAEDLTDISSKSYENDLLKELIIQNRKKDSFRFSNNIATYDDMEMIADELVTNKSWTVIYLWEIRMNNRHMSILMNGLKLNSTIVSLNLDRNLLSDEGACVLATILRTNTSLKVIYLNDNHIRYAGAKEFANMLYANRTLMHLELSSNEISDRGVVSIMDALKVNKHLRTLCLNNNKFTHIGAQHLGHMLEINQTLTDLQISSNNIGDDGASAIIDALQNNQTLKSIHLGQTMITTKTMQKIEEMLLKNNTLTCLHLNNNDLGDVALKIIMSTLKKNTTLTTLDLSMNDLTKRSAHEIGTLLKQTNSRLQTLMLSNNRLGDDGIGCIARALIDNQSLVKLVIEDIGMTYEGIRELAILLCVNKTLRHLTLDNNLIGSISMKLLSDVLRHNNNLQHLYLNNCNLKDECIPLIENILEENTTLMTIELVKNHLTQHGKMILNEASSRNKNCSLYLEYTFHAMN